MKNNHTDADILMLAAVRMRTFIPRSLVSSGVIHTTVLTRVLAVFPKRRTQLVDIHQVR